MDIIEYSCKLDTLVNEDVRDLLGADVDVLRSEHGVDNPDSLKKAIAEISEQGRLLNVGIVGRVKAGKSSLLNALFFEGRTILPKAATPMTAALTTISYGEKFSAHVEFYTQDDIKKIQERAQIYEQRLRELEKHHFDEMRRRLKRAQEKTEKAVPNDSEIEEMANKKAKKDMQKNISLDAAHDQAERIRDSGIDVRNLDGRAVISANSAEDLAGKLIAYVGADGQYMAFTKAVHILMPLDDLRDIKVIDTPGLNDPVQSREDRTIELLKTCDAIFIVSPAHQFLNEQDLEMMGRITAKEGIQELVVVSSQIDSSLYGSEKRARLSDAVSNLQEQFADRTSNVLAALKKSNPEVGAVFDLLIQLPREHLLHSSGVAYSLSTSLEMRDKWDGIEQHTWGILSDNYPDFFSLDDLDISRKSLNFLANVNAIRERLSIVREKKNEISRKKYNSLVASKIKGLDSFRFDMIRLVGLQIKRVNGANINDLNELIKSLGNKRKKLSKRVDLNYNDIMNVYKQESKQSLIDEVSKLRKGAAEGMEKNTGEEQETRKRGKDGALSWIANKLWGGGQEIYRVNVSSIMTAGVAEIIRNFIRDSETRLSGVALRLKKDLDVKLSNTLTPLIVEILGEDSDIDMISEVVYGVINGLPHHEFIGLGDLGEISEELKPQGKLSDYYADQYINNAVNFLAKKDMECCKKVERFVRDIDVSQRKEISDMFIDDLQSRIESLKKQKADYENTITRLKSIEARLKEF